MCIWKQGTMTADGKDVAEDVLDLTQNEAIVRTVLLFQPKYRLLHPDNYIFSSTTKIFSGPKYEKKKMGIEALRTKSTAFAYLVMCSDFDSRCIIKFTSNIVYLYIENVIYWMKASGIYFIVF